MPCKTGIFGLKVGII